MPFFATLSGLPPVGALLKLGRVSNLPTIWTNTLAAILLAGGHLTTLALAMLFAAMSLFYVGGMYLNDAFDAEIDAIERPERPIPSGVISRAAVFALGFAMLGLGILGLAATSGLAAADTGYTPIFAGIALAAVIVFYNCYHKSNPLSPVVMGLCRVFVFIAVASAVVTPIPGPLWVGAALILCYIIGLTYAAKQENLNQINALWPLGFLGLPVIWALYTSMAEPLILPFLIAFCAWITVAVQKLLRRAAGDIPRAVAGLIAGISLLDAMLIASTGSLLLAMMAVAGFSVTLLLQRVIPGT